MWLLCGGMPRSGSTLQYQLVAGIVELAGVGHRVGWKDPHELDVALKDASPEDMLVVKTHDLTADASRAVLEKRARAFFVYRDIRDAFASSMRKKGQDFDTALSTGRLERLMMLERCWTSLPDVYVARYERMVVDLGGEVRRVADHLGLSVAAEALDDLARRHNADANRQNIRGKQLQASLHDPRTLLHPDHFTSDKLTGSYLDIFTPEQIAEFEQRAGQWLSEHGYPLGIRKQGPMGLFRRLLSKVWPSGRPAD